MSDDRTDRAVDPMTKKTLTMILCGGKGERLYPLTRDRAKPSVPFLGAYRIVDFSLSNALNSGLRRIVLLTQYKSLSLDRHITNGWNIFHAESGDFIISLSAQGRVSDNWYEGTADAVFQNIYTIQHENPEAVLVLSGDHIYASDYRRLLDAFRRTEADALIMARTIPVGEASRFGVIGVDAENRIVQFAEKPRKPFPAPWDPGRSLISMGVYLFRTPVLIKALMKDARDPKSSHDFGKDIIPALIAGHRVFAHPFDGYWEDIGTIDAYWEANMAFLEPSSPGILRDPAWPIRTYKPQYPPTFVSGGDLRASIIGPGSSFTDCRVVHSIVGPGVRVDEGTEIVDSIVFGDAHIRRGARLRRALVDKGAVLPERFEVGFDADKDAGDFKISKGGVRVVPKGWSCE